MKLRARVFEVALVGHANVAGEADSWLAPIIAPLRSEVRERVELAVSELVDNAFRHGYLGRSGGTIRLRITVGQDRVIGQVEDEGSGAVQLSEPLSPPGPDARDGRGLYIVHQISDHVRIHNSLLGGTSVEVEFRRPGGHGGRPGPAGA